MTRRPFDPGELDGDPQSSEVASELERYAGLTSAEVPHGLEQRVMGAVGEEPTPRRGLLAALLAPFAFAGGNGLVRAAMIAGTAAVAVLAVVVAGELAGLFLVDQVGPSPSPPVMESPSTPSPSPSPSPTVEPSPTLTPTPVPTPPPATSTPRPSAEPTKGATAEPTETPEPSSDDHSESPHPSEDNSGPGGGSDDSPS